VTRIHERCDACGFDGGMYSDAALLQSVRELGERWRTQLAEAGDLLRRRPAPATWSALEYAAHSRDITALHAFGVDEALTRDEPVYPPLASEELIETAAAGYADADPDAVVADLDAQARRLAALAEKAGSANWYRGLTIGSDRMDVRRLLEHGLHDSVHHLRDVERGLARLVV
jgi:S-DNA-T family DNA segregation ATPase FtsK/SpoIIIE